MTDRIYGGWAGNPRGIAEDKTLCIQNVWGDFGHGHQCSRKRGHGKDGLYCKQHDPERVAAAEEKKDDELNEEMQKSEAVWKRRRILAKMASGITTVELKNYKLVKRKN